MSGYCDDPLCEHIKPRSRIWWFFRFLKSYHRHGAHRSLRGTWSDAGIARRGMPARDQYTLTRISWRKKCSST